MQWEWVGGMFVAREELGMVMFEETEEGELPWTGEGKPKTKLQISSFPCIEEHERLIVTAALDPMRKCRCRRP